MLTSRVAVSLVLALSLSGCLEDLTRSAPTSGTYFDQSGATYDVSTDTAAAVNVRNADTCLMFWRKRDPQVIDGVEELRGGDCSNLATRGLNWTARYDYGAPDRFTLTGPGHKRLDIAMKAEAGR